MNYTGCNGNGNRFMTEDACENTCRHQSKLTKAKVVCAMPKSAGHCRDLEAKWYFDSQAKTCKPFYYTGCGGNDNRFDSWDECEKTCPNAYPPEIDVQTKVKTEFFILKLRGVIAGFFSSLSLKKGMRLCSVLMLRPTHLQQ